MGLLAKGTALPCSFRFRPLHLGLLFSFALIGSLKFWLASRGINNCGPAPCRQIRFWIQVSRARAGCSWRRRIVPLGALLC